MPLIHASTGLTTSERSDLENVETGNHADEEQHHHQQQEEDSTSPNNTKLNFWERRSVGMANRPWMHCGTSILLSLILGIGGMVLGGFSVSVDGAGWESRGTLIADRHMQFMLIDYNAEALYNDRDGNKWDELIQNKQENYFDDDDDDEDRRLEETQVELAPRPFFANGVAIHPSTKQQNRPLPFAWNSFLDRRLQEVGNTGLLEGCNSTWYTSGEIFEEERLWPVWRLNNMASASFFQANVLQELCEQEALTQEYLVANKLCFGCNTDDRCLQPYSTVLFARLVVQDGMTLDCGALAQAWNLYKESVEDELVQCVVDLKANYIPDRDGLNFPESCPEGFHPLMLDEVYDTTQRVQYTSSVYATTYLDIDELYDAADKYARGAQHIEGVYDTQDEDFVNLSLDAQLGLDMMLALGSAVITYIAMIIHTRSWFLATVGLLQITLSFPLAYTVYTFLGGIDFFPFLNFIGVFVLFALGADDVFVAVDKWKNARMAHPNAPAQEIAIKAFPDAAGAMFLTTATTSIAFFGTAFCPVAPIKCFAIFVGLMIIFDYMLCCLLVFPALVIYDNRRLRGEKCCGRCGCFSFASSKDESENTREVASVAKQEPHEIDTESNLIRRLFTKYYRVLHKLRWPLLVLSGVALVLTAIRSTSLDLPTSSDVRLYDEDDNQYEQNFVWRQHLLSDVLEKKGGSTAYVIWGVTPADNGDVNNPDKWSSLVLDESFEPSQTEAQVFLRDFCDGFFSNDFAGLVTSDYECPINRFDAWLGEQSVATTPSSVYQAYCGGATSLPIDATIFDDCISGWAEQEGETTVLSRQGKVEVMYIKFNSRVRYDSPYDELDDEWHAIEDYMKSLDKPHSARNAYHTSEDFWWYDTNGQMLTTAYTSSGIAMAAAAAAILFSSRSLVLTLFSTLSVAYVLTSVTATLVALGWTLGFLEAILFAILIGISCDFVIHFAHAYTHPPGVVSRNDRTLYALLSMGPSILAAAITTFAAATLCMFTVIIFFKKFGIVLFMTILQATIGSFFVFLTITDTVGPSHPTYLYEKLSAKVVAWREARRS